MTDFDELSFNVLVSEHLHRVYAVCFGFVRNKEDAEDLTQEVFVKAYKNIHSFRGECSMGTWLYRIAVTTSLDFLKSKQRKKRLGVVKKLLGIESAVNRVEAFNEERPDISAELMERRALLEDLLEMLPVSQKAAVILSKIKGFKLSEIADILHTSESAVESLISRGMMNLKNYAKKYCIEYEDGR